MTIREYALAVEWPGNRIEFVPAESVAHAQRMANQLYRGQKTEVVGRDVLPWRAVRFEHPTLTTTIKGQ